MISIRTDSEATARRVLERIRLITYAESLGGVESLIDLSYASNTTEMFQLRQESVLELPKTSYVFSVGIENVDDLIADLDQALNGED